MRFRRRLLALVTTLSMLRGSASLGEVACTAVPDVRASAAVTADAMSGSSMTMQMHGSEHTMTTALRADVSAAGDSAPEHTAERPCCDAMASCTNSGAVPSGHEIAQSLIMRTPRIREAGGELVASFASAPEPPPPKA